MFSEFERVMIRGRVMAGQNRARASGAPGGDAIRDRPHPRRMSGVAYARPYDQLGVGIDGFDVAVMAASTAEKERRCRKCRAKSGISMTMLRYWG
jgi:hypothetical protein